MYIIYMLFHIILAVEGQPTELAVGLRRVMNSILVPREIVWT